MGIYASFQAYREANGYKYDDNDSGNNQGGAGMLGILNTVVSTVAGRAIELIASNSPAGCSWGHDRYGMHSHIGEYGRAREHMDAAAEAFTGDDEPKAFQEIISAGAHVVGKWIYGDAYQAPPTVNNEMDVPSMLADQAEAH